MLGTGNESNGGNEAASDAKETLPWWKTRKAIVAVAVLAAVTFALLVFTIYEALCYWRNKVKSTTLFPHITAFAICNVSLAFFPADCATGTWCWLFVEGSADNDETVKNIVCREGLI